jgi:hypothetical protein
VIGEQIEHYRILQHLGDGGMGTVFRALDTMLEREVALKVLRTDLSDQADVTRRFRAEAVTLARLSHPHIATLYGLVRHGSQLCMVMELVPGETLAALMQRERAFGWERAARLTVQILTALDYAHGAGVIHRDIKPSNVIVSATGIAKVLDFGIARVLDADRLTRQGLVIGTPQYMAPEQIRAVDLDGRADVYSVGVLLYEMLAGRLPFRADNDIALMYAHLEGQVLPLAEAAPTTPPWLFDVVGRALAKTPDGRFPSAGAFRDALDARLPHRPSGASLTAPQPSVSSEAPTLVLRTGSTGAIAPRTPIATTPAPGAASPAARSGGVFARLARLRAWALPRVTWEYQAGPDGMLTVRRALRPRSGVQTPPAAAMASARLQSVVGDALSETTAFPDIAEARRASQRRTAMLVGSVLAVAAGVSGASLWFSRPDPAPPGPSSAAKSAVATPSGAASGGSPPAATPSAVSPLTPPTPSPVGTDAAPGSATTRPPAASASPAIERSPAASRTETAPSGPVGSGTPGGETAAPGTTPSVTSPSAAVVPAAEPVAPAPFTPPANLRDEVLEELLLLVPGSNGYDEVEVSVTFERERLLVFDTDEERTVASVRFQSSDGPSLTGPATWLTGSHDWFIVPTTTGRLVLQLDYRAASRAAAALEARTGRPTRRERGELDK